MLRLTKLGPPAVVVAAAMAKRMRDMMARLEAGAETADTLMVGMGGTVAATEAAQSMAEATVMAINCRSQKKTMVQTALDNRTTAILRMIPWVLLISLVLGLGAIRTAFSQETGQKTFTSAAEAADAFDTAVQNHDEAAMQAILGPSSQDVISSGDPVADKKNQDAFANKYHTSHQFLATADGRTFLYIGDENWPTPIPLKQNGSQWYFDTEYGKQEILYRRIGFNELDVIRVCTAIVDAQRDYYAALHDGASQHQYAQNFHSTAGTQDGLFWEVKEGAQPSPLGPLVAEAASEGYHHHAAGSPPHPFHGYLYRILTNQGANAPGGAQNYIVGGKMIGGFALVAYPVLYRDSGVMTFIVNQDGQIYQKDLGPNTDKIASEMEAYDPDATWQSVNKATVASLK
jgi:hypothetical protein